MVMMLRQKERAAQVASRVAQRHGTRSLALAAAFSQGDAPTYGL